MDKAGVVLVALNKKTLNNALGVLNYNNAVPFAVFAEDGNEKFITVNKNARVQVLPFSFLSQIVEFGKNFRWLICGQTADPDAVGNMKTFLAQSGVPENKIVNFSFVDRVNPAHIGNLRLAESGGMNCFATGNSFIERGLDFTRLDVKGVNLAAVDQDLRQGFQIAKHIFAKVKRGTIKHVFIGLSPYSLRFDARKDFSTCADDLRYALELQENFSAPNDHDKILAALLSGNVRNILGTVTDKQADPNFDKLRAAHDKKISVGDMTAWQDELARVTKNFDAETVENNLRVLEDYVKLCVDNGAKPVGIILPFTTALRENYNREIILPLRLECRRLEKIYNFTFIDMFDAQANYDCFSDMTHLNQRGAGIASAAIDFRLRGKDFWQLDKISALNYEDIFNMSNFLAKDDYNDTIDKYFKLAVKNIRGKKKIRVGFVSDDPSMWCGDKLYNLFADNKRCDTTFFLCLQKSFRGQQNMLDDFQRGIDGFKARGINVVAVTNDDQTVPAQDLLIMLRPYFHYLPKAFELASIGAQTLMAYIPYGFNITSWNIYDSAIYRVGWKLFTETQFHHDLIEEECRVEMPRGFYSGYTKLDEFFEDKDKLTFDWKMTRPDAKKIIWAPHWSISSGIFYATFQWNYKFMYEFAKTHPEISWVVKPHPMLFASAVGHGVFPNEESFNQYLKAWDDLPNAKVFSGPYYQGLFATSDGMIMDCGSWVGEYQYTHKPMIFLTRNTQQFNKIGDEIMKVLYRVDGKNLTAIAALMQRIFIDGKDDMFETRMKFFDNNLNYVKTNSMTASNFVFKTIAKELRL